MIPFKEKQRSIKSRINYLRDNATQSELEVMRKLQNIGVKFVFQKAFIEGDCYCIVDFYLPKPYKVCIEVDGGYHNTEEQLRKDRWRDRYLESYRGFRVVRLRNEDARVLSESALKELISP